MVLEICGTRKCQTIIYRLRNTGIPWYFMTSSIVDNFCQNPTTLIVCSALADSPYHNCVLTMYIICKLSASGCGCHVAGIYVGVLMYADDLLLISSTCSDLRRMPRTVFSKPTVYNTVTLISRYFSDTGIPCIPTWHWTKISPVLLNLRFRHAVKTTTVFVLFWSTTSAARPPFYNRHLNVSGFRCYCMERSADSCHICATARNFHTAPQYISVFALLSWHLSFH